MACSDLRSLHFIACDLAPNSIIVAPNLERITWILPLEHDLVSFLASYSATTPLPSLVLLTETFFHQETIIAAVSLFLSSAFQFPNANMRATTALRHLVLSRPRRTVLPHNLTVTLFNLVPPTAHLESLALDTGCATYLEIFSALIDSPVLANLERLRICARSKVPLGPNATDEEISEDWRRERARAAIMGMCESRGIVLVERFYSLAQVRLREQWHFYTRPFGASCAPNQLELYSPELLADEL